MEVSFITNCIFGDEVIWAVICLSIVCLKQVIVMLDGSLVVGENNHGTCYVWRLICGT